MAETMKYTGILEVESCCVCGTSFAVPSDFRTKFYKSGGSMKMYCPNGHQLIPIGASETSLLKARLASAREESEHYRDQRDHAERQARAHKGHHTRTKNRIANGVCPCCNRTFINLGKHMKSKHPDFTPTKEEE